MNPVRRVLQWSVGEATATHWWLKSHQEVPPLTSHNDVQKMGNILADTQATEAVDRSARGPRLAVPLPRSATYGARPTAQGLADGGWRITHRANEGRRGPSIPEWNTSSVSPQRRA